MKKIIRRAQAIAAGVMLMGLNACIDPIELVTEEVAPKLVVDGLITDQFDAKLNRVTLTWTEPFNGEEQVVYNRPAEGATVTIRDSRGNNLQLVEGSRGVYFLPDDMAAQAGESYSVHIRLQDGREYASRPELLQAAVPIGELTYEYKAFIEVAVNGSGQRIEKKNMGFQVDAAINDPKETQNYYRWDAEGIFEYYSRAPEVIPTPPSICWSFVERVVTKAVTAEDRLFNGNTYKQPIVVIPADIPTRYQVKVRQFTLSEHAYTFWRLFNQQQASVGSIFDPPPAKIRGNLYSTTNPEDEVVGYFGASGVAYKTLLINRAAHGPLPGTPYDPPFVPLPYDCRKLFPNSTAERPEGF